MDRLQKKCFIASAAMHLLLLILLFVSPAFVTPEKKVEHLPILTFIPSKLVDDPFFGGGSPKPPPQEVQPEPPKPSPPRREVKPPAPKPKPVQPKKETPKKAVETPTPKPEPKRVIIPTFTQSSDDSKKLEQEKARAEAKRLRDEQERMRDRIAKSLIGQLSSSTEIQPVGPGGAAYANYTQVVKSIYERAWNPPQELDGNLGTVKVQVVIARSGKVTSAKIKRGSGNRTLDRSVERALQIKHIAPFPKGTTDLQRTFNIDFNLKAKRFTG